MGDKFNINVSDMFFLDRIDYQNKYDIFDSIEKFFKDEQYDKGNDFVIEKGYGKILLSAPHTVEQVREGKIKFSENRTGTIIMLLKRMLACTIIYKTRNNNDDANYDETSNYKTALLQFIKNNDTKCVLDFHISAPFREYDLDIGTGYGKNILGRCDLQETIINGFRDEYEKVFVDKVFPASNPNTVSATVAREIGIPTFQIEINWNIISDYDKMLNFTNCISDIIQRLEDKL